MASLRGDFEHFYPLGDDYVETAIRSGLVTPDTNVLLALYRFQGKAREQLFGALEKLGDSLWVPHQVGLEFHRRRLDVIDEQANYLKSTRAELDRLIKDLRATMGKFGTRIGLDKDRGDGISGAITNLQTRLTAEVTAAQKANNVRLRDHDSDPVLEQLEVLLDNRVGARMKPKELKAARKEARRRVAERIPPGYEDAGKADPTGDYLIFRQVMQEAKKRQRPLVFVTDDEKPDWYRRKGDLVLGARHELRDEMMTEAGVQLAIMTTEDFLLNAKKYLEADVSPETVDQAKELPGIVENDDLTFEGPTLDLDLLQWLLDAKEPDAIRAILNRHWVISDPAMAEALRKQTVHLHPDVMQLRRWRSIVQHKQAPDEQSAPEDEEPSSPED